MFAADEQESRLRADLARDRRELRAAVADLEVAARNSITLGARVRKDPVVWMCGAFLIGLGLGLRR